MPEGFLDGYVADQPGMTPVRFLALAEPLDGPYVARSRALARSLGVWLVACFAERRNASVYNTALLAAATARGADAPYLAAAAAPPV